MTCWAQECVCGGDRERQRCFYLQVWQRNLFVSELTLTWPCSFTPCQNRREWERKKSRDSKQKYTNIWIIRGQTNKELSEKVWRPQETHTAAQIALEIYWMFCSNDGKLDQGREKWVQNEWREDWVLSLTWSQISMHSRSLLWHWRCPWCWKDVVTQRIMFYLEGRKEVGINLRGKLRFQQAISFVWAILAGTLWSEQQRCLKVTNYLTKQMATIYRRI